MKYFVRRLYSWIMNTALKDPSDWSSVKIRNYQVIVRLRMGDSVLSSQLDGRKERASNKLTYSCSCLRLPSDSDPTSYCL
ncbi:hypothetical protein T265_16065, partial [Opisthorchis viverrini]